MEIQPIKSITVFKGRIFTVKQDQILLPNGQATTLDIIDHVDSVVILPINPDGNLLFVQQYRHPAKRTLLELPAGVLNKDEEPEICARRELREETGMAAKSLVQLGGFFLAPGYSSEFMNAYLAKDLYPGALEADPDEFITVKSIPMEKALSMALNGEIQDAKTLTALFLAKAHTYRDI